MTTPNCKGGWLGDGVHNPPTQHLPCSFLFCWLDADENGHCGSHVLETAMERWKQDGKSPDPCITVGGELLSDLE